MITRYALVFFGISIISFRRRNSAARGQYLTDLKTTVKQAELVSWQAGAACGARRVARSSASRPANRDIQPQAGLCASMNSPCDESVLQNRMRSRRAVRFDRERAFELRSLTS